MEKYTALLGNLWPEFQKTLRTQLATDIPLLASIDEKLIRNSGKMLRPMLALLIARAAAVSDARDCICVAAATEILHNATLLHDDVADQSALRRGAPTLFSQMGAGPAVMVGDFWLASAVGCIMDIKVRDRIIPLYARVLRLLSEGQLLELAKAQSPDADENDYLRIIYCKTASLFETACRSAAVAAGVDEKQEEAAETYGNAIGMAFQIRDDIFDYGDADDIGKPVGIDLEEGKVTLPLIGAIRQSGLPAKEQLQLLSGSKDALEALRSFVVENGGLDYAREKMDAYIARAIGALQVFPESEFRNALTEIAAFVGSREN